MPAPVTGNLPIFIHDGTTPKAFQTTTFLVQWGLAGGCPQPDYFEIILYTGTDPTNEANWLCQPVATKDGTSTAISIQIGLSTSPGAVHAAVCSIYLSGQTQNNNPVPVKPVPTPRPPKGSQ